VTQLPLKSVSPSGAAALREKEKNMSGRSFFIINLLGYFMFILAQKITTYFDISHQETAL
jgi:hypothetical protein